jgi:hypothetical protein
MDFNSIEKMKQLVLMDLNGLQIYAEISKIF